MVVAAVVPPQRGRPLVLPLEVRASTFGAGGVAGRCPACRRSRRASALGRPGRLVVGASGGRAAGTPGRDVAGTTTADRGRAGGPGRPIVQGAPGGTLLTRVWPVTSVTLMIDVGGRGRGRWNRPALRAPRSHVDEQLPSSSSGADSLSLPEHAVPTRQSRTLPAMGTANARYLVILTFSTRNRHGWRGRHAPSAHGGREPEPLFAGAELVLSRWAANASKATRPSRSSRCVAPCRVLA